MNNKRTFKHGHRTKNYKSPTYISWDSMKVRCSCKKHRNYKYYGGRGISYCKEWETFENFLRDMGERPKGKTLDRVNNDGNYEPDNCRWATAKEQINNRRKQKIVLPDLTNLHPEVKFIEAYKRNGSRILWAIKCKCKRIIYKPSVRLKSLCKSCAQTGKPKKRTIHNIFKGKTHDMVLA